MQECPGSPSCGFSVHIYVTFQTHSDFPQQTYDNNEGYNKIYCTSMDDNHVCKAEYKYCGGVSECSSDPHSLFFQLHQ